MQRIVAVRDEYPPAMPNAYFGLFNRKMDEDMGYVLIGEFEIGVWA